MGDGSLTRLTRTEIEAYIRAGVAAAVKRAKVEPLGEDAIGHLIDIFSSRSRFSAVDIGDEVVLSYDGCGSQDMGTRINDLQYYEQYLCADSVEMYHHDYSFKPVKTVIDFEQAVMRQAQFLSRRRAGTARCPTSAATRSRTGPSPTGRSCCRWARSTRRVRLRKRRSRWPPRTSCSWPPGWSRPASTSSTSTRPARPATPTFWPRSRLSSGSARASPIWASR